VTATAQSEPQAGAISALMPLLRGLVWGGLGFALGAAFVGVLRTIDGRDFWSLELSMTFGYAIGIVGWLFGAGVWERWGREWLGLSTREGPTGWHRYFAFTTDHKIIGIQYLVTFMLLFLVAGLFAVLIRMQLLTPEASMLSEDSYNRVMSLHGIIMIAVAVAVVIGGFGNYFVPLLIGAEDVAFPRINALSFWMVPPVAIMLLAAQAVGGWDSGWTAYPPLSTQAASPGHIFFTLAIITFGISSILGGLNFLATIIYMRAPGMTWGRLPIFVWSMFATAILALLFTQFFAAAMLMVTLDRIADTSFFVAEAGGEPILYQHIFWFYSHPAVYIFVLPGLGVTLEILAHFSRKPLFAYKWAVGGLLGIVGLSALVWAHHMFVSGMDSRLIAPFLVTTEIISVPTGLVFLSALGTIWMGRLWLRTPMLFALAVVFNFMIGGITGIFLADAPTDVSLSDTYFVVAHFHYTIIGGEIFALFAAVYYWFPKITGKMYSERLGQLHFWLMFLSFNATFIPMFWAGLNGMNRRIASYTPDLQEINIVISVMGFIMAVSFLPFVYNMVRSVIWGEKAEADPWRARTLEWRVPSPPPLENFPAPPRVTGNPYDYGVPNAPAHGVLAVAGASEEDEA